MAGYRNAPDDLDCQSAGGTVFIGNVGLSDVPARDADRDDPATTVLSIDVMSAPGSQSWTFRFVTLELQIEAPAGARFVEHSGRNNYHREVLADPAAAVRPDPDRAYWVESDASATTLRIRDDETALLSGDGNGRTYYVGVVGVGADTEPLRFTTSAAASLVRESSCHLVVDDVHSGDRIAGYLD